MIYELKIYDEKNPKEYSQLTTDKIYNLFQFIEETPGMIVAKQLNTLRDKIKDSTKTGVDTPDFQNRGNYNE